MSKHLIIIILLISAFVTVKAQDTVKRSARPDSVIRLAPYVTGKRSGYLYSVGGKIYSADEIRMKLLSYPPSANELNAAKSNMRLSLISACGVGVSGIAALAEYKANNKYIGQTTTIVNGQSQVSYIKHNETAAYVLTGLAGGFLIAEITTLIKASSHHKKAFRLYNQRYE